MNQGIKRGPAPTKAGAPTNFPEEFYMMHEESTTPREGVLVVVDLRDAEAWARAGRELRAWGRRYTRIHPMTNDIVILEYMAGGAADLEISA